VEPIRRTLSSGLHFPSWPPLVALVARTDVRGELVVPHGQYLVAAGDALEPVVVGAHG
jgi:hypothetical protein